MEINCFLTCKMSPEQSLYLHLLNEEGGLVDPVTGLKAKTIYGRPNFEKLFHNWTRRFENKSVGVFYCGPKVLALQVKWNCIKNSKKEVSFKFHEETF